MELKPGPLRVMALSPALSEMLFALLPDSNILAVTNHCNYPPERVARKPAISVMPLDLEKIIALNPTLLFTEEGITSASDLERFRDLKIPVISFSYRKVNDVIDAMDSIRCWTNAGPEAMIFCDSLRGKLQILEKRAAGLPDEKRKRILALVWTDPIIAFGSDTWMSDKMRLAGGRNALEKPLSRPYPQLEREQLLKLNPDVLFGGSFGKMDSTFFKQYPELKQINAYRNRRIYALDDDLASRPGPRFLNGISDIERYLQR